MRLEQIKRNWDSDAGGWKTFVIFWVLAAFLAWAIES